MNWPRFKKAMDTMVMWGLGAFAFSAFAVWATLPDEGNFSDGWEATLLVHFTLVLGAHIYGFRRGWKAWKPG